MEFLVESNDSNYLYIGVAGRSWTSNSNALNGAGAWSLQADGYVYDNGSGGSYGASYRNGDRVTLRFFCLCVGTCVFARL